jgi:hypothetical protein
MLNYACCDAIILFPILKKIVEQNLVPEFWENVMVKSESCYEKLKVDLLIEDIQILN